MQAAQNAVQTAVQNAAPPTWLTWASGWVALGFLAFLAVAILYYVFTERIDLSRLLSEPNGDASLSRFQLLIFTFVVAASLFLIIASSNPPAFPPQIPQGILILLGISSSSYLVSKGIQFSSPEGVRDRGPEVRVTPAGAAASAGGSPVQFRADVSGLASAAVTWSLEPPVGMGAVDATGLYTPPPAPAGSPPAAPAPAGTVVVRATSAEDNTVSGTATVTLV
jgi:hypothetical protein